MKKLFLLSIALLSSCSSTSPVVEPPTTIFTYDYSLVKDDLITWGDIFAQEEDTYYVYFYSEICKYCNSIKREVLDYYLAKKCVMRFVDVLDNDVIYSKENRKILGVSSSDDLYILGTPFLLEVKDHISTNYYAGSEAIKRYINK